MPFFLAALGQGPGSLRYEAHVFAISRHGVIGAASSIISYSLAINGPALHVTFPAFAAAQFALNKSNVFAYA